ncbi:PhzF family phenazine biosynthesis isomerase [Paenibacillus crassostreae]|uniref:Isomerase n=1 Tax=Paenibacillus crassostreae TaxID=1763538 RepID=A0A162KR06_9BACL|nr:PhzF family phenazine biosynthesis isomerase [Paenibacillus crassostreae]AOZ92554.1 isomerase [Paenibacillus crassostreae]OAB72503.1 isomerase [Paenibacillus crassostreae]
MTRITVFHYDAFSKTPDKGNPAGVVLNANNLTEMEMQRIAYNIGFNETVFVLNSENTDLRLRYFTPGHEINLCGHATMGSLYCLKTRGLLGDKETIQIETNVGVLPITFSIVDDELSIKMKQDQPKFITFNGDVEKLAASMGVTIDDLDQTMPIVYGSTGTWTLIVPVKDLRRFHDMKPENKLFPDILTENPRSSIHPICFETYDKTAFMHARHFSSPYSGTTEDSVTGTASGVMGAYYLTYVNQELGFFKFTVEQGQEIDKDGRVHVEVLRKPNNIDVFISGTAVFVRELEIDLD